MRKNKNANFAGKRVAIIGLGLLGTSLGLALKNSGYWRSGWSRKVSSRKEALNMQAVDEIFESPAGALKEADISVICLPIPQIISFCIENAEAFKKSSVVTDVGSVKECIVKKVSPVLAERNVQFVGSHPMAGSEKSGANAARFDLYCGATVFITPAEGNTEEALRKIKRLWEKVGAQTFCLTAKQHDALVACTSHLPHLTASALVQTILDSDSKLAKMRKLGCAGGFRDCTRTASSNPQMWREIFENNKNAVLKALGSFQETLQEFTAIIKNDSFDILEKKLDKAKSVRDAWLEEYESRAKNIPSHLKK
ncbi:MAG: prephenate dehydrogenase/arogenate dehydrogenase family protein [Candidatus Nanoarchaeia archaeon]